LSSHNNIPITIYNLSSKFCVINPEKGIHCVQYIIDANYCSFYSLYFLYLYAKHDFPKTLEGIKPVIEETFVDKPIEIKRNPCKATNKFRLVIMSFILTVLSLISNDPEVLNIIKDIYDTTRLTFYNKPTNSRMGVIRSNKPSYLLLEPSIAYKLDKELLKFSRNGVNVRANERGFPVEYGGTRKRKRSSKKARKTRSRRS
jgi:hypothetical protein